jgi:hypothetical protein
MGAAARLDFLISQSVERDGAILNELKVMHQHFAALDAPLALLALESR